MATKTRSKKPASTKSSRKKVPAVEFESDIPLRDSAQESLSLSPAVSKSRFGTRTVFLLILVVGLLGLFLTQKGLIVAAMVNGRPIFRWELASVLSSRFGKQTIEGMINERLVEEAAKGANVAVSEQDVLEKEEAIVKGLGPDVKIEDLLKYQGMSKTDFDNQVRLQLLVQKILSKDLTITDSDVASYIKENKALMKATEEAAMTQEAKEAILEQKVGEKVQTWFSELRSKAKIYSFL